MDGCPTLHLAGAGFARAEHDYPGEFMFAPRHSVLQQASRIQAHKMRQAAVQ